MKFVIDVLRGIVLIVMAILLFIPYMVLGTLYYMGSAEPVSRIFDDYADFLRSIISRE